MGLREPQYTRRLRPSEEEGETLPEMGNPARNGHHATQAGVKKQRGKTPVWERKRQRKVKGRLNYLTFLFNLQGLT
jgi:hypothetical protein